jgi:hypothetical protein
VNGHTVSPSVSGGSGVTPASSWTDIASVGETVLAPATAPVDSTDATTKMPDEDSWASPGQEGGWSNTPAAGSTPTPGWGASATSTSATAATPAAVTSTWSAETEANGNGSAVPSSQQGQVQSQAKPKLNTTKSKTPATSKLSWAQIARYVLFYFSCILHNLCGAC